MLVKLKTNVSDGCIVGLWKRLLLLSSVTVWKVLSALFHTMVAFTPMTTVIVAGEYPGPVEAPDGIVTLTQLVFVQDAPGLGALEVVSMHVPLKPPGQSSEGATLN
jgi:hypothetical protein